MPASPRLALAAALALLATLGNLQPTSSARAQQPPADALHEQGDALHIPPELRAASLQDADVDLYNPSAYMAGSVAVQVLLPESSGTSGLDSESWTPAQVAEVGQAVDEALGWWKARTPGARLRFERQTTVVPSAYEPIAYGLADEGLWIGDLLRRLGFAQQGYFGQAFASADALRKAKGTDWALTIFVVNSTNDADGRFADKRFAYAYIGGPFLVVTSDAGVYGTDKLAPVLAHEIGHLFGALDQYAAAKVPCTQRAGYLDVPTGNSRFGTCPGSQPSIMIDPVPSYLSGEIDPWALGQVGYRDSDGDGLIDVLDTVPSFVLNQTPAGTTGQQPVVRGTAVDEPLPGPYGFGFSVNTVERIEYQLNNRPWQPAAFDSLATDGTFALTLPLFDGQHRVALRSINSVGAASPVVTRQIEVRGMGSTPTYRLKAAAFSAGTVLTVTTEGPAGEVQLSLNPGFADTPWQPLAPASLLPLPAGDGEQTVYARFRTSSAALTEVYTVTTVVDRTPPAGLVRHRAGGGLALQASDSGSGVADMQLSTSGVSPAAEGWLPFQPSLDLSADQLIGVRFRDRAGNVSPLLLPSAAVSIALPLVAR